MHLYSPRSPLSARLARTLVLTTLMYTTPSPRISRLFATLICVTGPRLRGYNRTAIGSRYLHLTTLITPLDRARGVHTSLPTCAQPEEPSQDTIIGVGHGGLQAPEGEEAEEMKTRGKVRTQEEIKAKGMVKTKGRVKVREEVQEAQTIGSGLNGKVVVTGDKSAPAQAVANVLAQEPETTTISSAPKKKRNKKGAKKNDTQSQVTVSGGEESVPLQIMVNMLAQEPEHIAVSTAPKKKKRKVAKQNETPIEASTSERMLVVEDMLLQASLFTQEWPASPAVLEAGHGFLKDVAASTQPVLLIPDRTVDGLCAGTVISLTLRLLGKQLDKIHVHFVRKGQSICDLMEKGELETICVKHGVEHIIIVGQGSVETTKGVVSPLTPVGVHGSNRKILVIDRNQSTFFPPETTVVTSYSHPPIAPVSMLSHILCALLHPRARTAMVLPTLIGTLADLSPNHSSIDKLKKNPFSLYIDFAGALKKYSISWIKKFTSLLNVFRRTPLTEGEEAIRSAWDLLQFDPHSDPSEWPTPKLILSGVWGSQELRDTLTRLTILQSRSREELDQCKRVPPKFTNDGRLALIEISSKWQIQPQLARRWVSALGAPHAMNPEQPKLLAVACANTNYAPGQVHFSVRRTAWASAPEQDVDLIALLKEYTERMSPEDRALLGESFARGYKDAIAGVLDVQSWEVYNRKGLKTLDIGRGGGGGAIMMGSGSGKKGGTGKKKAATVPYTMEGLRALGIGRGGTFFVKQGAEAKEEKPGGGVEAGVRIVEGGNTSGVAVAVPGKEAGGVTWGVTGDGIGGGQSGGQSEAPCGGPIRGEGGVPSEVPEGGDGGLIKRGSEPEVGIAEGEGEGRGGGRGQGGEKVV